MGDSQSSDIRAPDSVVRFNVLGPLRVEDPIGQIALPGIKERTLLCLLLARANQVVAVDELVDGLWGADPPPTAEKSLQAHVVRLRDSLEPERRRGTPGSLIFTVGTGYVLRCNPEALDSLRFETLVADGHQALTAGAAATATRLLGEALDLWRGRPFGDYTAESLERERARLSEIERTAREDLAQSKLNLGKHRELIPDLERQVSDDPLGERAWAQLMLALYRAGRQAEALSAFHRAREVLADELGIEPGAELQSLQHQILDQDPALLDGVGPTTQRQPLTELAKHDDPFVGRDAELARLAARWEFAHDPARSWIDVVHIYGPAGIGKTRLISEFVNRIASDAALLYASGAPQTSRPLAVFERLASVGEYGSGGDASPADFGERLGRHIARTTRDDSLLAVLDDVDSANDEVLEALSGLIRGLEQSRGLIVVTSERPLSSHIAPKFELELAPLTVGETVALVASYAGESAAPIAAAEIAPSTGGIPGKVHAEAAEWARRRARSDIGVVARKVAAERSSLGLMRNELRARIVDLQTVATIRPERQSVGAAPYKGLAPFSTDDSGIYFGREHLVGRLAARMAESPLLILVGSSGSGKSSLARAGLLAALADGVLPGSETWQLRELEVARLECAELQSALEEAVGSPSNGDRALLLVDQLEQVFSQCDNKAHRRAFLDTLAAVANDSSRRISIIATLRSDYFGHLADSPAFALAAAEASEVIGPMTAEEIQRAVELPAQRAGASLEPGLAAAIAADAFGRAGALPLLSTALLELWEARSKNTLTWSSYRESGGMAGAVARLAEDAYGRLTAHEQVVARRVLLRTVGAGEDGSEVSRRVPLAELEGEGDSGRRVLTTLADRRLMSVDRTAAEVTHEALYRQWPRLRGWLDEDREGRELHRRLIAAARDWHERGEEESDLLRGARLLDTAEWAQAHRPELNDVEHSFLAASIDLEERQAASERERTRQTLRINRRLKFAAVGLGLLVVATTVVGAIAFGQSETATREAIAASAARLGANALVQPGIDRELLLAAAAYGIDNSFDTRGALLAALLRSPQTIGVIHGAPDERLLDTAVSPDGSLVAIGTNVGTIAVWDWRTRTRVALINSYFEGFTISFAADGRSIMAAGSERGGWHIRRWRLPDGSELPDLIVTGSQFEGGAIDQVAFAKAANSAAVRLFDGDVYWLDLESGDRELVATKPVPDPTFPGTVAISVDGKQIAVTDDTAVTIVDPQGTSLGKVDLTAGVVKVPVIKMTFSVDGEQLAIASDDGTLHLVDASSGALLGYSKPHTAGVYDLAFTPNGASIISGSEDNSVAEWTPETGKVERFARGHTGRVFGIAIAPDGNTAFSAAADGTLLIWDLSEQKRFGARVEQLPAGPMGWASSADGSRVAMVYADGSVSVADLTTGTTWQQNPGIGTLAGVAFSHDGNHLAVAGQEGRIAVLDPSTGEQQRDPIDGYGRWIGNLSYSPDDSRLAVAEDGSGWIVDMGSGTVGPELFTDSGASSVAWSADGKRLALGQYSGSVVVRDLDSNSLVARFVVGNVPLYALAWSNDGSRLVTGSNSGAVQLWSTDDWKPVGSELRTHGNYVFDARFTADSRWLATYGGDGAAALWDVATGRQLGSSLIGTQNEVGGMWLSPDGTKLTMYQGDGSIWSWALDDATWLQGVCSIAGRDLTADEWQTYAPDVPATTVCSGPAG